MLVNQCMQFQGKGIIGFFFYQMCNNPDDFKYCQLTPQINMSLFRVFCSHSHAFQEIPRWPPSYNYSKLSTLNCGVLMECTIKKRRCILLYM